MGSSFYYLLVARLAALAPWEELPFVKGKFIDIIGEYFASKLARAVYGDEVVATKGILYEILGFACKYILFKGLNRLFLGTLEVFIDKCKELLITTAAVDLY